MRYVTECTWNGYHSGQARVVHRTVHQRKSPFRDITCIQFTDGTTMDVETRPALPREKVKVINGYSSLLMDFFCRGMKGFCRVNDLYKKAS